MARFLFTRKIIAVFPFPCCAPYGLRFTILVMGKRTDPTYVTELGTRLLKAKADVKRLQAEWDAIFQQVSAESDRVDDLDEKSVTNVSRIIDFLNNQVKEAFTANEIAAALGLKSTSTATTLSKLVKKNRIRKQGADRYASMDSPERFSISIFQDKP